MNHPVNINFVSYALYYEDYQQDLRTAKNTCKEQQGITYLDHIKQTITGTGKLLKCAGMC